MKYDLLADSVEITRYETKELKVRGRINQKGISINNGAIALLQGTNLLSIDDNAKATEKELRAFAESYFNNPEIVTKRLNAIINPTTSYQTIM